MDANASAAAAATAATAAGPFERLPDEIIEQILLATDPNGFASLVVVNSKWRAVSQRPHLYRHHLAPSMAGHGLPPPDADKDDGGNLPRLRRLFARQVKRTLLDAYMRPRETVVRLVSTSISSSTCPGGEGMQFGASPAGHHVLAYNSSRIYVVDVRRELKILRRPASACINDDASLLAVLSTEMQVDLYDLRRKPPRHSQSIILDNSPRTIALSPCGSVLAAAYNGGIEVSSLDPVALPTGRRAVKCDAVDALSFSLDGSQILGTTTHSSPPSTVVLTAPYYDPGSQVADSSLSAMWTTSILFPNTSRDCSHAILLQDGSHGEAEWTFTYDRSFETFRAVRLDDLRNGTTYFTGPVPKAAPQSQLLPCTLPASTYGGDLVAAGFQGNEVWIYGVPTDLDAVPAAEAASSHDGNSSSSGLGRHGSDRSSLSRHASARVPDGDNERVPQWQVLCDRLRNNLVAGSKVSELAGVSTVKWVSGLAGTASRERLVVTAPGVSGPRLATEEEDVDFVDGGRIALLDFDYGLANGDRREMTIEMGTDEAEVLEEEKRDMETEVAIVRRRTVAQRRGGSTALLRASTMAARESRQPLADVPRADDADDDPLVPRRMGRNPTSRADDGDTTSIEEQEALDAPYAHASPRSGTTLRRAATAAAVNRRLNPRTADGRPIEYRRADGRGEHPHESDADNWVPPPPPYQKEDPGDMPAFLRGPSVAPLGLPDDGSDSAPPSEAQQTDGAETGTGQRRPSRQRTASESTTWSRWRADDDVPRSRSSPSARSLHLDPDNIYDVSPPASPRPRARQSESGGPLAAPGRGSEAGASSAQVVSSSATSRAEAFQTQANPAASTTSTQAPPATSGNGHARPHAPLPPLHIPDSLLPRSQAASAIEPRAWRLSNAQTWPLQPQTEGTPAQAMAGYPLTAPPCGLTGNDLAAALPPAPSLGQMASLNRRISQGYPHRLSGGIQMQKPLARRGSSEQSPVQEHQHQQHHQYHQHQHQRHQQHQQHQQDWAGDAGIQIPEFDRPLIISTPKGVSGSFDAPGQQASTPQGETPILAPVPRHPRQNSLIDSFPTAETLHTLDTIYSARPEQADDAAAEQRRPKGVSSWLRTTSTAPSRTPAGVVRRPSRAERSAAKNMLDARKRGWTGRRKKKAGRDPGAAYEVGSSAGWTDVSSPSAPRERKCVIM